MIANQTPRVSVAESLESRRLLSAQVIDGTLVVTGSAGPDRIRVYELTEEPPESARLFVFIGGAGPDGTGQESYRIPSAGVTSVLVRAGAGDDVVDLRSAPLLPGTRPLTLPARVDAGIGDDIVYGSRRRDFLSGGFGRDRIVGYEGNDWIEGGWGDDALAGAAGNDVVFGGYGNDSITGGAGDDRLNGGPGNDRLGAVRGEESFVDIIFVGEVIPEQGNDVLAGASGDDWLGGGPGNDHVSGGVGFDHFSILDEDGTEILGRAPTERKDVPAPVWPGFTTFAFRGTVTSVTSPRGFDLPADFPTPGTEFRGTYTFDPGAPDTNASPDAGTFTTSPNGPIDVRIGNYQWMAPASYVVTHDGTASDFYEAGDWIPSMELVSHPELARTLDRWNFQLSLEGDGGLLSSPWPSTDPPPLAHATRRTLTLTGDYSGNLSPFPYVVIEATLDELTRVPNV